MVNPLYEGIHDQKLSLADHLALDRTALAVDRTFMAYMRTALTLLVAGISLVKFFDSVVIESIGWPLMVVAVPVTAFGIFRRVKMRRFMDSIGRQSKEERREAPSMPLGRQHHR